MRDIRCNHWVFSDVEAVLFDKDGTLANSELFLWQLGCERSRLLDNYCPGVLPLLHQRLGIEANSVKADGVLAVGTRRETAIAAATCLVTYGLTQLEADVMVQQAFHQADRAMPDKSMAAPLFPGSLPLLSALNSAGIKVGILSSDSTANVEAFVQRYDLHPYIQSCLGTDGVVTKPDPELFNWACQVMTVSPQRTVMVGDSRADMAMAKAARALGGIGVTWGWIYPCPPSDADAIAERFDQIELICKML